MRALALVSTAWLLASCGGGGGGSAVPPTPARSGATASTTSSLALRIDVPQTGTASNRRPAYVSPATQSLAVAVLFGGTTVGTFSVNLSPSSPSCQTVAAALQCSLSVPVALTASGAYTLATATFDQPQSQACSPTGTPRCAGNVLSAANVAATLQLNATNVVAMVLGGLANGFTVTPVSNGFFHGDVHSLSLWGPQSQSLVVQALDADGNTIVGAGAPALTLTAASSTVQTASTSPGAFTLQATASGSPPAVTPGTVQLTATATPVGSPAAPFSQTIPLAIAHTAVFVSNNSSVAVYFDGNTTPSVASIPGLNQPRGVAVDAGGTLYIGSHTWPGTISECTPGSGYTSCSTPISTLPYVEGVATDASGNLWITANGCDLLEFLAGATTPALDLSTGFSTLRGVAADKNGNVWTANQSWPSEVAGYAPPLSTWSTPFATLTSAINAPIQVSAGGAGDIWVANSGGAVTQFAAPIGSASTPSITLGSSAGIWGAQGVAVDAQAGVWIANTGGNSVVHCPAPVSAATCTNFSVSGPIWIAAYPSAIDP